MVEKNMQEECDKKMLPLPITGERAQTKQCKERLSSTSV